MRPDERELDDEIRGHLAINIKQRIERGEDPVSARRAALKELGYLPAIREEMRRVWYSRCYDAAAALVRDVRFAFRSLLRAKTLTTTVVITLALGIGANAAVFSVVRSVLLRPLVNREADRLVYIWQTAEGLSLGNMTFSVPEIQDFKARTRTVSAFGDFSTVDFTMIGFGQEPRLVKAGVVNGSFFDVMGLRPVIGRLLTPGDDGKSAAGAVVLTYAFWRDVLGSSPAVLNQSISLGSRSATVVGVLEPSVPYPTETQPGLRDSSRDSFFREATQRISELPGVDGVAFGSSVPFRDRGTTRLQFAAEGYQPANGEESPTGRLRYVSGQYFAVLGVPLLAGRDFTDADRTSEERVAIVNESVARRLFPNGDILNRRLTPTNLGTNLGSPLPSRIVGVVADVDEDNIVQEPSMIVYYPEQDRGAGGRLFVRASGDPRVLIPSVTRTIREIAADQAVERPAVLEDIRAEVLAPGRLNAFVFSALGGIALLIAIVGVAGVLAFSVSARTREFGVRLAIGSAPRHLLAGVLRDGAVIAVAGIVTGVVGGVVLTRIVGSYITEVQIPGVLPIVGAAGVLIGAAVLASLMPAVRASRIDVVQALRSE
jgi:MacB-like protein/FtsX-like permease family protein